MVATALDAGAPIHSVFAGPDADDALLARVAGAGITTHHLAAGVIERVADTVTPQPIAAIVRFLDRPLDVLRGATFVFVCADVRDPGNAGTIVRTAEACGASGVVCADGSVDVYNPKTVRASAGSLFHVPIVAGGDPVSVLAQLTGWGMTPVGAVAHGGSDPAEVDLTAPLALVLGNEAAGLPPGVDATIRQRVTIPLHGRAESLNVGMAAAVLGFEVARQRRSSGRS
jgi:TrmH family RNA methyltransferase